MDGAELVDVDEDRAGVDVLGGIEDVGVGGRWLEGSISKIGSGVVSETVVRI